MVKNLFQMKRNYSTRATRMGCALVIVMLSADASRAQNVAGWGENLEGQTNVPPTATNLVAVAAGAAHSLALGDDGSVIAWGRNWDGQASVPSTATNSVAVSAGWAHSVALRADGT